MIRKILLASLLVVLLAGIGLYHSRPAAAQSEDNLLKNLPVSGLLSDGGTFTGVLSVDQLSLADGKLLMQGLLNGTARPKDGSTRTIVNQPFSTGALLTQQNACDILSLDLGPLNLDLLGLTVDLSAVNLEINAIPGAGNLLGNLLCAVASLLDGANPLGALVSQLSNILGRQLVNLPVSGPLSDGGTFQGTLNVTKFALNNVGALVVTGVLNGTATPQGGAPQSITEQAFSTTSTLAGAPQRALLGCSILNLDLGPLNLDLLGLTVDLSAINLDVTAVPGAGNLLGNLLCGVANLLNDGGSVSTLLNNLIGLINQLLNGLLGNLSLTSGLALNRVEGSTSADGSFVGSALITDIAMDNAGKLLISGLLSGTVTRSDKTTAPLSNFPFTTSLNLSGQNNQCDILNLDLGPLFLNILGLTIDLSPVALDIAAQPGEGKLLGNLLCAVAGLLDPGTALSGLLSQLTSLLNGQLSGLPASGPLSDGGTFSGTMDVTGFSLNQAGDLVVNGLLNGTATPNGGQAQPIRNQPFSTTGNLLKSTQRALVSCGILNLDLGPLNLDLLGLTVDLSAVALDINAVPGAGNLLGNLLCAVAGLLDDTAAASSLLNGLLGIVDSLLNGLLGNLSVTGVLPAQRVDSGVAADQFDGSVNITDLVLNDNGKIEVSGLLNGVLTQTGQPSRQVTNQRFTALVSSITSQGSCDILTLDLGPLNLDLLGLTVDLAPVNLDIAAVPGEGNLLGNLLCAVAGLLDPGTALGTLLTQLTGILSGALLDLPTSGPLSDGGSFTGTLDVTKLALNQQGQLTISGLLNGTATPSGGQAQQLRNQAFTTTASLLNKAQRAGVVCDILALDLGPLNLDLLGLTVDLSALDLNINAVPGQGNLLGNLLCAVAGLLDGTQATSVEGTPSDTIKRLFESVNASFPAAPRPQTSFKYLPILNN